MGEVTIRRAEPDDALVVAALHLQFARELGMAPEPGYLDRVASTWLADHEHRPTWLAQGRGEHAGILETRHVYELPWPGRPDSSWLHIGGLFVAPSHHDRGMGRALTEAMVAWARARDVTRIRVRAPDDRAREFYERLGFVSPGRLMELDLRGPPDVGGSR